MNITLLVTRTDYCLPNLECECQNLGLDYHIEYIEDCPEIIARYQIRHSPNIFINGTLAFREQPSPQQLRNYLDNL